MDRFGDYCNDLHKAAYYLDPAFIDEVNSSQEDTTTPLLFRLIEKLCGVLFPEEQDLEELQKVRSYANGAGSEIVQRVFSVKMSPGKHPSE